jgi:hypothetical protein
MLLGRRDSTVHLLMEIIGVRNAINDWNMVS